MNQRPELLAPCLENIPAELRARNQWVVWRAQWEEKPQLPGGGRWNKIPHNAANGQAASSTDPQTWSDFETAVNAYKTGQGRYAGVGFVLHKGDSIVGIDLDHAIDENGNLTPEAAHFVAIVNGYTEISPSATGVRIFVRATLPPGGRKRGNVEMYETGRFLTVTGQHLPGTPENVPERQAEVEVMHAQVWPPQPVDSDQKKRARAAAKEAATNLPQSDADLLELAYRASNGGKIRALYNGDISGYPGQSEADLALCMLLAFYTGDDPERLDRLFRGSALMRPKWDRNARTGETYGAGTIRLAIDGCHEFYNPPGVRCSPPVEQRAAAGKNGSKPTEPTKTGFVGSVGSSLPELPNFSSPPRALTVDLLQVPALTPDLLPQRLRPWIEDIAARGSFPLEYVAAAALTALSSVIGRQVGLRPKRHDDWQIVPNLFGAVVGQPGVLKTPAVQEALGPLRRLESEAHEEYEYAQEQYEVSHLVAKARAEAAKDKLKRSAKKGATEQELRALAQEAAEGETNDAPVWRRHMVNDTTVEKLGELLRDNPNGLLLFRDELTGFFKTMDRQGHESDRAFYLEGWNGTGSYTYDRIGRGTVIIPSVCLSLFGTIQPGPLARHLRRGASGEEADGFVQRMQMMVYPDPPAQFKNVDRWPNTEAKNTAFMVFRGLNNLDSKALGAEETKEGGIPFLRFAPDAQDMFDEWRTGLESRLLSGIDSPLMQAHLAKYRKLMPALALIFHLVDAVTDEAVCKACGPVSQAAADLAIRWCEFLEAHARRIYQAAMDGDPEVAIRLADRIKQSLPNPFTYRQVVQKGWAGLSCTEEVERAIGVLEDRGWVQTIETPAGEKGGRPSTQVWIHPDLQNGRDEKMEKTSLQLPTKPTKPADAEAQDLVDIEDMVEVTF